MPRKTLALILGLVLVTAILLIIAVQNGQNQPQKMQKDQAQTTPVADVAHTVLSLSPDPVQVAPGTQGSVNVTIDTSDNAVTAVQLELLYDPTMLSNVKVTPGPLFTNAVILIDKNNVQTGRYTYAFGITPSQNPITGQGVAATVTFTARGVVGKQSQIVMQPESLVTARGIPVSVLKSGKGTTVVLVPSTVQGAKVKASPTPTQGVVIPTKAPTKPNLTPQVPPPTN